MKGCSRCFVALLFGGCLGFLTSSLPAQDFLDEFDDDPVDNTDFWELHEPQTGIVYSLEDDDATWWRMSVPFVGDDGLNFDSWTTVDRGPKLRHAVDPTYDWTIETLVRVDPFAPPFAGDPYLAGLMIQFGEFDLIHWNIGQQRGATYNIFMERSGFNNIITGGFEAGLLEGTPVGLRIEKVGSTYTFSYFLEADDAWTQAGTYDTDDPPTYIGLVMKTWGGGAAFNVDFDYFDYVEDIPPIEAPAISTACEFADPDIAYVGHPFTRPIEVAGTPLPTVTVTTGPAGLGYDPALGMLTGWTPDTTGEVAITVEAANPGGSDSLSWTVKVLDAPLDFDDDFDDDPRDNPAYWELYEPQGGIQYDTIDADGTSWFHLDVPQVGDLGVAFDHWATVNNAPQLRHPVQPGTDFLIETRLRIDPAAAPVATDNFLAGLMIYFSEFDLVHWNIGQERMRGLTTYNIFMERAGANNLIQAGYESELLLGTPVGLRVEKSCDTYSFFYRLEADGEWVFAGKYETADQPVYVGLIMKTWGAGAAHAVDFDYFNFIGEEPPSAVPELSTPCDFGDPDIAWEGMPYARPLVVAGLPAPNVSVTTGQAGLGYDNVTGVLSGWTPTTTGSEALTVEATNAMGSDTLELTVQVEADPVDHDDEFDDDPRDDAGYWELYEPQTGGVYSIFADEEEDNNWFRMDLLAIGDDGLDFDNWLTVDRAPQLRHAVAPEDDFLIETRVRIDSAAAPLATDPFYSGLEVVFGPNDIIQWAVGNERMNGFMPYNIVMERSGFNNLIIGGYEPNLISSDPFVPGAPVQLRIEKKCDLYNFFYRLETDAEWTLAGSYRTSDPPVYVGLMSKNYGGGVAFASDYDYFDILEPAAGGIRFRRGDPDSSGAGNITDVIVVLNHLFTGTDRPGCWAAADANSDGSVNVSDPVYELNFLFGGGDPIGPPGPEDCGPGTAADEALGCEVYDGC